MRFLSRALFSLSVFLIGGIILSGSVGVWGVQAQQKSFIQGVPFVTNHTALEYRAGIQNCDIVQDDLGRIYVANNLGLLDENEIVV